MKTFKESQQLNQIRLNFYEDGTVVVVCDRQRKGWKQYQQQLVKTWGGAPNQRRWLFASISDLRAALKMMNVLDQQRALEGDRHDD